jgi:hypothetical protein
VALLAGKGLLYPEWSDCDMGPNVFPDDVVPAIEDNPCMNTEVCVAVKDMLNQSWMGIDVKFSDKGGKKLSTQCRLKG